MYSCVIWLLALGGFFSQAYAEYNLSNFSFLMGNKTSFWKDLQSQQDRVFFQECADAYKRHLVFLEEQPPLSPRIPHVIHFIWLGPKPFPSESVENIRSWIAFHPDWTFKFWTDRPRPLPCRGLHMCFVQDITFTRLGSQYVEATNWGCKSDILRYEILYQEGGVYLDHDAYCLCSFNPLHDHYDLYAGLQVPRKPAAYVDNYGVIVANGIIGTASHHPILDACMDLLIARWGTKVFDKTFEQVLYHSFTPFTLAVRRHLQDTSYRNMILPAAYFYGQETLPHLYSTHFFASSWSHEGNVVQDPAAKILPSMQVIEKKIGYASLFGFAAILIAGVMIWLCRKNTVVVCLLFLLGIGVKGWTAPSFQDVAVSPYVLTLEDKERLAMYTRLYEQQVSRVSVLSPLPQTIHLIWLFPGPLPKAVKNTLSSWRKHNPQWKIKLWRSPKDIDLGPLQELYSRGSFMEKALILQLAILDREGGIATQAHVKCLQPMDFLSQYHFFASLAQPKQSMLSSSIFASPGVIGSIAKHPILQTWRQAILDRHATYGHFYEGRHAAVAKERIAYFFTETFDNAILAYADDALLRNIVLPPGHLDVLKTSPSYWYEPDATKFLSKFWLSRLVNKAVWILWGSIVCFILALLALLYVLVKRKLKSNRCVAG